MTMPLMKKIPVPVNQVADQRVQPLAVRQTGMPIKGMPPTADVGMAQNTRAPIHIPLTSEMAQNPRRVLSDQGQYNRYVRNSNNKGLTVMELADFIKNRGR